MTDHREPLEQALEDHDITLAVTAAQLLLLVLGAWLLLRIVRGLRR